MMNDAYTVRPLKETELIKVSVPGSKSITNRALLLSAMETGKCRLSGVLFSGDSRAFLSCLKELGFSLDINEEDKTVIIEGTGGIIPNKNAAINVGSAGTAARFLTVFLAFAGGHYVMNASEQMCKRPMGPLIEILRNVGVNITCTGSEGHFPFIMDSNGINADEISVDTDISTQFASALMMAAPLLNNGLRVRLTGSRTQGAYINITLNMMKQFGYLSHETHPDSSSVLRIDSYRKTEERGKSTADFNYNIEPDVSAACYFYAMAPICHKKVLVNDVHFDSMQGDIKFIKALESMGCSSKDTEEGILLEPPVDIMYPGTDIDMNDFSDQAMTMAAVAACASSPTTIRNIGHIRLQESDRLNAIVTELTRLGCICRPIDENTGIRIEPAGMHGASIETYEDHRIAMAFSLIGLKIPGITILNPGCCAKTFENYFDVLDSICVPASP